jgi:hypothetical protein
MQRSCIPLAIGLAVIQISPTMADDAVNASQQQPATNSNTVPNDENNYLGDVLSWPTDRELKDTAGAEKFTHCLPAGQHVVGDESTMDTAASGSTQTQWLRVRLYDGWFSDLPDDKVVPPPARAAQSCPDIATDNATPPKTQAVPMQPGMDYYISAGDAGQGRRIGFDYGALLVPFKFQLGGAKNFSGAASIGPYVGYRIPLGDVAVFNPVAFAGASAISASTTDASGNTSTEALAGFSYGFGTIMRVKDSFSIGVILGADHVDSSAHYAYNDKWWASFEIGYSFAQ